MTGELSTASSLRNTREVPGTGNVTVTKKNPTALLILKTSCRYIMECYLAINKNEVLPFATTVEMASRPWAPGDLWGNHLVGHLSGGRIVMWSPLWS